MKLSTYNKTILRNIVEMETKFSSEKCSQVYIRKDYEDFLYPAEIINDPKVKWDGYALSNNKYSPMELSIEKCKADVSIYEKMSRFYQRNTITKKIFKSMMKAQHLRLSLDEKNIFSGWDNQIITDKKNPYFILHDKNISNIKDSYKILTDIRNMYGWKKSSFGFKFPINIIDMEDLKYWGNLPKIKDMANIYVYDMIPNEIIDNICLTKQKITYYFTKEKWSYEKIMSSLPQIFLQGMFLSSHSIILSLKIDNNFDVPLFLKETIRMLNNYFEAIIYYHNQLVFCGFTYCKYCYNKIQENTKIELFKYLKKEAEEFFNLLYNTEYVTMENNILIPHMYSINEIADGGGYGGYYYKNNLKMHPKPEQLNYAQYIVPETLFGDDNYDTRRNQTKN